MKLKLDENLPESLLATLKALGHDVDNVTAEGLAGRADADVWQAAQDAERFLITQDLDFSDIRKFSPGTHQGLMMVRGAQSAALTGFRVLQPCSFRKYEIVFEQDFTRRTRRHGSNNRRVSAHATRSRRREEADLFHLHLLTSAATAVNAP